MSESSESNTLSSSEDSESTQSQGNRSRSSTQESQGSDVITDENTAKTPKAIDWGKLKYSFSLSSVKRQSLYLFDLDYFC